jgi:hypothetical protein
MSGHPEETLFAELDIADVASVGEHSPEDLSDESEDADVVYDDGTDLSQQPEPDRPESGWVPVPPQEG